jgi:hypothetical protein
MSISQYGSFEGGVAPTGTTTIESIAGIAAVVLAILGLARVAPVFLVGIATIAVGAALLAEGAALAAGYGRLLPAKAEDVMAVAASGSPMWFMELLIGVAGIVLGILALLNVEPMELVAAAAIAFGGGLVLTSGARSQLAALTSTTTPADERIRRLAVESASSSAMMQVLTGLAGVVLGILALAGLSSLTLVLVALLATGAFLLLNGSTASGIMVSMFRH